MNENKVRSKIYSYFYGSNTGFQQFLLVAGIFLMLVTGVADTAYKHKVSKALDKYYELSDKANDAENTYDEYYYEYHWDFDVERDEKVTTASPDMEETKKEYNNALDAYLKAKEKADKAYEKYNKLSFSTSSFSRLFAVLGVISILTGAVWFLIKKLTFNKTGEDTVDEELARCKEQAKTRGLEKLNLVAEQIEAVDPVVLDGVAYPDSSAMPATNFIVRFFKNIIKFILKFDKLIIGLVCSFIIFLILQVMASSGWPIFILFLLISAIIGGVGYLAYRRYEIESYVSPRKIKSLENFDPNLVLKLGSDEKIRASLPAITVYMFGTDQLYVYTQYIDLVTGKIFMEGVNEYFYEDVVGITSSQKVKKIFKHYGFLNLFLKSIDYFKESVKLITSGCTHTESYIVDIGDSLIDTSFISMRNLIRDKKLSK